MEDPSPFSQNLLIRADASRQIGTGHIMRCLALAQAWHDHRGEVTFLTYCESDSLYQRILGGGFKIRMLNQFHHDRTDLLLNLKSLLELKKEFSSKPWFVLDGYHFNTTHQKKIKEAGYRLLVLDDMANLRSYHADILLNQNIGAEKFGYKCSKETKLLLGMKYAMLRSEFLKWRGWKRKTSEVAKKIMVTFGGSDSKNMTLKTISALNSLCMGKMEVRIIVGAANTRCVDIKNAAIQSPVKMQVFRDVQNMPEFMSWADLAITGGGVTCLEMAFMGVPTLIVVLAENQRILAEGLTKKECAINLGFHSGIQEDDLALKIKSLALNAKLRKDMSASGRKMIDGRGTDRVLSEMSKMTMFQEGKDEYLGCRSAS